MFDARINLPAHAKLLAAAHSSASAHGIMMGWWLGSAAARISTDPIKYLPVDINSRAKYM